jgi:hypothetical protein
MHEVVDNSVVSKSWDSEKTARASATLVLFDLVCTLAHNIC